MNLSPITRRRLANFRANRRGYVSLWLFGVLFLLTLFAEGIANDRPILARSDAGWLFPVLADYAESDIIEGGLPTSADWKDPDFLRDFAAQGGWAVWPPVPFSHATIVRGLDRPAPSRAIAAG